MLKTKLIWTLVVILKLTNVCSTQSVSFRPGSDVGGFTVDSQTLHTAPKPAIGPHRPYQPIGIRSSAQKQRRAECYFSVLTLSETKKRDAFYSSGCGLVNTVYDTKSTVYITVCCVCVLRIAYLRTA